MTKLGKLNLFTILLLIQTNVFAQNQADLNLNNNIKADQVTTLLTNKKCSGQFEDRFSFECNENIINKTVNKKRVYEGLNIIIDTQDPASCREVETLVRATSTGKFKSSENISDLCQFNPEARYKNITLMWESDEEYLTPIKSDFLTNTESSLKNDTRNLTLMMAATMGLLWVGPESISKWNKDEIREKGLFTKWRTNFHSKPTMDKDNPIINYVGHPISGAIYYNIARSHGYSAMQSFGYTVLMSTFFWEYGFEAIAEKPSIQDLFITPIIGALIGEVFHDWSNKITNEQNGKVLGSKFLGKTALFLLNPATSISNKINEVLGHKLIQSATSNIVISRRRINPFFNDGQRTNYIGIRVDFHY